MEIAALKTPRIARRRAKLGKALARYREHRGLRVSVVAKQVGVDRGTWYRWERGESSIPAELVPDVAAAVDTNVHFLMAEAA